MTTEVTLKAHITGRVQGVWFRGWTQAEARRRGIRGWVRNEADGSVTAVISGPGTQVAAMVEALHAGPKAAVVARVETEAIDEEVPEGFEVRG